VVVEDAGEPRKPHAQAWWDNLDSGHAVAAAMALLESGPLLVIVLVFLLLFGASAIPKLARSLGQAKGEFTKAKREFDLEAAKAEAATAGSSTSTGAAAGAASEEQVRKTARELGIPEAGRALADVKRDIAAKLA